MLNFLQDPYGYPKELGIFHSINSGSELTTEKVVQRIINKRMEFEERNKLKEAKELKILESLNKA